MESEKIVCAAIDLGNGICAVSLPPKRHHHILQQLSLNRHAAQGPVTASESAQGFITSAGRFVERKEAGRIAIAAGQARAEMLEIHNNRLFTEHMW